MSHTYRPVIWNKNKYLYDLVMVVCVTAYILIFLKVAPAFHDGARPVETPILRMRAFGSCAFLMLTVILCIGPLARLDKRFQPLLYNRRHFGVLTCLVALIHVNFVINWYYSFSPMNKFVAVLVSNTSFGQLLGFPFEVFGIITLLILIVLAVTSHDFWLSFLTPPLWKAIHMSVYVAYISLIAHIAFGYYQQVNNPAFAHIFFAGAAAVAILHLVAGRLENQIDAEAPDTSDWVEVGDVGKLIEKRGHTVILPDGERAAVFKYNGKISAISNLCAHQNGPLGEGRILYGCVTCPWHGYQYRPEDGRAPAPYTEKLATYNLKLEEGVLWIDPNANEPGTYVEPVKLPEEAVA